VESDLVMAPEGKLLSLATSFLHRLLHSHVFQNDDRLLSYFFFSVEHEILRQRETVRHDANFVAFIDVTTSCRAQASGWEVVKSPAREETLIWKMTRSNKPASSEFLFKLYKRFLPQT
jgi:hypothetical protein